MAGLASFDNALRWSHFRLRGGWQRVLSITIVYGALMGGLIMLSVRVDPSSAASTLQGWMIGLLALQVGVLLLVGGSAIVREVRRDFTSKMIESHRLMPVSGVEAVAGYILGAVPQAVSLAFVNLFLGIVTVSGSTSTLSHWLLANVVLGAYSVFAWVLLAFLATWTPSAVGLFMGFALACYVNGYSGLALLPGLALLSGPVLNDSIFAILSSGGAKWTSAHQISLTAQVAAMIFFYIGATRKYRREDVVAFGPWLGLALLVGWIVVSMTGLLNRDILGPSWMRRSGMRHDVQVIASVLATILVGLVPLGSAAWLQARWQRRRSLGDPYLPRRPVDTNATGLLAAGMVAALAVVAGQPISKQVMNQAGQIITVLVTPGHEHVIDAALRTGMVAAAFFVSIGYLLRILYRVGTNGRLLLIVYTFALWIAPLAFDMIRHSVSAEDPTTNPLTWISGCSPLGAMILVWATMDESISSDPGLAVQACLAIGWVVLFHLGRFGAKPRAKSEEPRIEHG